MVFGSLVFNPILSFLDASKTMSHSWLYLWSSIIFHKSSYVMPDLHFLGEMYLFMYKKWLTRITLFSILYANMNLTTDTHWKSKIMLVEICVLLATHLFC
ncbi:hypothetical protein VPH35_065724 [Triticum aestivum]